MATASRMSSGLSRWRRRRRIRWVRRPATPPGRRFPGTSRAPRKPDLPGTHRLTLKLVRQWLLSDGEYDHSAAAEDEHAKLLAAGASQRLTANNTAGPVIADQAARWALGAIPPLLPRAIQKLSGPRWTKHDGGGSESA